MPTACKVPVDLLERILSNRDQLSDAAFIDTLAA